MLALGSLADSPLYVALVSQSILVLPPRRRIIVDGYIAVLARPPLAGDPHVGHGSSSSNEVVVVVICTALLAQHRRHSCFTFPLPRCRSTPAFVLIQKYVPAVLPRLHVFGLCDCLHAHIAESTLHC